MTDPTPRPERVTLADEEKEFIDYEVGGRFNREHMWAALEQIVTDRLAAREQALREEIAGQIEALPDVDGLWGLVSRAHAACIALSETR